MEAGTRLFQATAVWLLIIALASSSDAASFRTQNFIIQAPTPQLAGAVGTAAEKYRRDLALHWLGSELRPWPTPCPIRVISGPTLAAQGVTTYNRAPVRDFQMEVVGTPQRIMDSVLPHEITHTILATHFGRPLPRWADEGICTTVEHASERNKHEAKLREFLRSRRGIAMNQLFLLTEYPNDVLPMYAQGYSVCRFLIDQQGPRTFIRFLHDYMQTPSWTANVKKHYGYESLAELQQYWLAWVSEGSGPVDKFAKASVDGAASDGSATLASSAAAPTGARTTGALPPATTLARLDESARIGRSKQKDPNAEGQGWYLRRLHEKNHPDTSSLASGSTSASTPPREPNSLPRLAKDAKDKRSMSGAIRAIAPPSVTESGPYSAAQPQPEQQISRPGIATGDATRAWKVRRLR